MFEKIKNIFFPKPFLWHIVDVLENRVKYLTQANYLNEKTLSCNNPGTTSEHVCPEEIVVSLTSFGNRLYDVSATIESIMQGTLKPNRIVLWLDETKKDCELPILIQNQCLRGLEVLYCKDIRSYTKLVPALKKFPESIIVTIDDDILYSWDMLERLVVAHKKNPTRIIANRVHQIVLGNDNKPVSYNKWRWGMGGLEASSLNFLTGVGGVLYPPRAFDEEVFNERVFLDICKYADDIWFFAMALKKGTLVQKCETHSPGGMDYALNEGVQDVSLGKINVLGQCRNDSQLRDVFEKYNLYDNLVRYK